MIHKLDIHSGTSNVITDNLAGSPTARILEDLSRSILNHVSAVACATTIEKCCFAYRVLCCLFAVYKLGCIFTSTMFSASVSCVQLLPDSSPVLLGCNYLRTDSTKAFKINSMISHSTRKLQHGRARSFARLVSGPQHPEACSTLSRADMEEPLNISDGGQTFTCAITGAFTRYIVVPSSSFSTSPSSPVLNCMEMKVLRTSLP